MQNKITIKGSKMITGSIVALITPMRPNSCDVDWKALEALVEWHIAQGTHALVAVGTTGESATLSVKEHSQVIRATVEVSNGRIPVSFGDFGDSRLPKGELAQKNPPLQRLLKSSK